MWQVYHLDTRVMALLEVLVDNLVLAMLEMLVDNLVMLKLLYVSTLRCSSCSHSAQYLHEVLLYLWVKTPYMLLQNGSDLMIIEGQSLRASKMRRWHRI
jgi:hypothetical protein